MASIHKTGRARKWLLRGVMVLAAAAIGFAILELAARWLYRDVVVLFPRYHTGAEYGDFKLRRIRPNSTFWHTSVDGSWEFRINSAGFRNDREFALAKPAGKLRVLCLGDSHTQGYEARQGHTFSAVIEKYLARRGLDAEVINAGVSGFSTAEELAFLENQGFKYQPDVVVVGFFANDYEDNLKAGLFRLNEQGEIEVAKTEHLPGVRIQDRLYSIPGTKWLGENSYAYALVFNAVWEHYKARLAAQARIAVVQESAVASETAVSESQGRLADALIGRMGASCRKLGIKLIVLDLPSVMENGDIKPSLSNGTLEAATKAADWVLPAAELIADYGGAAELHVPHGQRHISEFTHALLGVAAGRKIVEWKGGENKTLASQSKVVGSAK